VTAAVARLLQSREAALALLILVLMVAVGLRAPSFLALASLAGTFSDTSLLIILALGQMLVILTRGIDLSVAANLALTGMITAQLSTVAPELPAIATVVVALATGAVLGAFNGLCVWKIGIPPIVVTLGTLSIYRGSVFVLSGGGWVTSHQMGGAFLAFPRYRLLGLDVLSWLALTVAGCVWLMLAHTRFGRDVYAAGGNPRAAVYAGIDPGRTQFRVFCLAGMLAGLAGYLWVARYAVAYVEIAIGFELQVIAACVIGGVSIAGGIGSVAGCMLGALFLGVVNNALPIINVSPFWQMAIAGAVIVLAVVLNARSERREGRLILREAAPAAEPR
jgi:rhamnose transport system permease protein